MLRDEAEDNGSATSSRTTTSSSHLEGEKGVIPPAARRFAWLTRRHPVRAPWALFFATMLTVAAIMAISQALDPLYHIQRGAPRVVETTPRELLTFLVPAHQPPPVRLPTRTAARSLRMTPRQAPAGAVSVPVTPLFSEPAVAQPQVATPPITTPPTKTVSATPSPDVVSPTHSAVGPRWLRSGVSTARPLTAAARDSVLAQLSSDVPKLTKTPPRGGSFPMPFRFFSYSKSPEQQVRDSILNADIQARLVRLTKRGRAKRDSLRRADSLAGGRHPPSSARNDSAARPIV